MTNDPALGDGPLGLVRDAAVVIEGDRVVSVEPAGAIADERIDAGGGCVIPGFVDSHTHLVFAGDRADEFVERMAGRPYEAGGIATTVAAPRATGTMSCSSSHTSPAVRRWMTGTTHVEIKSGYGLDVDQERRCLDVAAPRSPTT